MSAQQQTDGVHTRGGTAHSKDRTPPRPRPPEALEEDLDQRHWPSSRAGDTGH